MQTPIIIFSQIFLHISSLKMALSWSLFVRRTHRSICHQIFTLIYIDVQSNYHRGMYYNVITSIIYRVLCKFIIYYACCIGVSKCCKCLLDVFALYMTYVDIDT